MHLKLLRAPRVFWESSTVQVPCSYIIPWKLGAGLWQKQANGLGGTLI